MQHMRRDNLSVGKEEAYTTHKGGAVWALRALLSATPGRAGDSPLFGVEKLVGKKVQVVPLTHAGLVTGIKRLAAAVG
ncbi:hypothetical protein CYMTET_21497 [Cymbomonas tetramitiformis]|uniref:Uncharacterized protein n=1 Tax=Cymbomonas tetramitiformis TaxID=36881 RepID=A0AAE0G2P8_9CHLO|nr:hypothetical protein CYMTET_21497 [Cymbomonas tetramitiformis]